MLTPEQFRSFQITHDGEARPDLVPFALKVREAISAYDSLERLKIIFTARDRELTDAFRSALHIGAEEDAQVTTDMYQDLCDNLDNLDGASAAAAVAEMDKVILQRSEARAQTYLASLTPEAAAAVLVEAEKQAQRVKGASIDIVAMAREHPDFVKLRIKETCIRLGLTTK